jgi:hypothetical protein
MTFVCVVRTRALRDYHRRTAKRQRSREHVPEEETAQGELPRHEQKKAERDDAEHGHGESRTNEQE